MKTLEKVSRKVKEGALASYYKYTDVNFERLILKHLSATDEITSGRRYALIEMVEEVLPHLVCLTTVNLSFGVMHMDDAIAAMKCNYFLREITINYSDVTDKGMSCIEKIKAHVCLKVEGWFMKEIVGRESWETHPIEISLRGTLEEEDIKKYPSIYGCIFKV